MQGSIKLCLPMLAIVLGGCQADPGTVAAVDDPVEPDVTAFEPADCGVIRGSVRWSGKLPEVEPIEVHPYLDHVNANRLRGTYPNPHVPAIDPKSRSIAEVLIRLDGVDTAKSKPWPHEAVSIEIRSDGLTICQGGKRRRIGIVRKQDSVDFIMRDADYHLLRARGAAFFSLPLVDAGRTTQRRLDQAGMVDLSEGAGRYWRRVHLAVLEHPYAAITDRGGGFTLDGVPAGAYRLTAWLPHWRIERSEHEPETAAIHRVHFARPIELQQSVTIAAGQTTTVDFEFTLDQFNRKQ